MLRRLLIVLVLGLSAPATAQELSPEDQTLADIRQELSMLFVEIQRLRRELSTTGAPQGTGGAGETAQERMDAIEGALQRLTARTEEIEFRLNRVIEDGTNRIGDLEFRLVELEGGDVGQLGQTTTLGGVDVAGAGPILPEPVPGTTELAVGEREAFEAARAALQAGDNVGAAAAFQNFLDTYPGGPLAPEAHLLRGQALEGEGAMTDAARAYLQSFSGDPSGALAPEALFRLGVALGAIGQTSEACVTLGEVGVRFPGSEFVTASQSALANLTCP